jgi:hypothetical protein
MGDMEMIYPDRMKLVFTDEGVTADFVNLSDCCELCNEPRMLHEGDLLKCLSCGVINHVDFGHAKNESTPQA